MSLSLLETQALQFKSHYRTARSTSARTIVLVSRSILCCSIPMTCGEFCIKFWKEDSHVWCTVPENICLLPTIVSFLLCLRCKQLLSYLASPFTRRQTRTKMPPKPATRNSILSSGEFVVRSTQSAIIKFQLEHSSYDLIHMEFPVLASAIRLIILRKSGQRQSPVGYQRSSDNRNLILNTNKMHAHRKRVDDTRASIPVQYGRMSKYTRACKIRRLLVSQKTYLKSDSTPLSKVSADIRTRRNAGPVS